MEYLHGVPAWSSAFRRNVSAIKANRLKAVLHAVPPLGGTPCRYSMQVLQTRYMPEKPFRILIAEDFDDNRIALKLMLKLSGYEVIEARDGREALTATREKRPHAIITDINLPEMDGLSVTRELRRESDFSRTPIIIVSAHDGSEIRASAREAGGTAYISKPIEFDELKRLLDSLLSDGN